MDAQDTLEISDLDPEDEDAWREAVVEQLSDETSGIKLEKFHATLDKEFAVFLDTSKYDYIKDIKEGYRHGLNQSMESRMFATIPEHAFWDIKKP